MEFYHPNFLFSAGQDGFLRMWALPCISTIKDCAVSRHSFTTSTWTGRVVQDDGEGMKGLSLCFQLREFQLRHLPGGAKGLMSAPVSPPGAEHQEPAGRPSDAVLLDHLRGPGRGP